MPGDVFDIKSRLKEYDYRLDIGWNSYRNCWEIYYYDDHNQWRLVKTIDQSQGLDTRIVDELIMGDVHTGRLRDFKKEFEIEDREREKRIEAQFEETSEKMYAALLERGMDSSVFSMRRSRKQRKLPGAK